MPPSKNENIVRAVLSLVKDLNEAGLETIKRDIDRKINMHHRRDSQYSVAGKVHPSTAQS